jgi:hypothetical protein
MEKRTSPYPRSFQAIWAGDEIMLNTVKIVFGSVVLSLALAVSGAAHPQNMAINAGSQAVEQVGGFGNEAGTLSANWQREKEKERPREREKDRKDDRREPSRDEKKDDKKKKPE